MNSIIFDDLNRENLALETAKCLEDLFTNDKKVRTLHKELLLINLTLSAYIEESQNRLKSLRLGLANEAKSTQKVVEILSDKCRASIMSASPTLTYNCNTRMNKFKHEDNNNISKSLGLQQARSFISWFKHMIDNERPNLSLYLADDAMLEWFGRTIKTRKKLAAFLKYDMQCSRHDFTSVENIERVQLRSDRFQRKEDSVLASPLHSPEMVKIERPGKKKLFLSKCVSPEWAEGCGPPDEIPSEIKIGKNHGNTCASQFNGRKRLFSEDESEIHGKGDGVCKSKRKCVDATITPPNREVGQGDCLPSTSGTDSDRSHDALNAQLPKLAVECNGYIEFARSRNSRSTESVKWERKCKVQISYSEDPLNIGEYIIWMLRYTDETKCRRNLLAAFEEVA